MTGCPHDRDRRTRGGFSLVELLVVVTILGVLARMLVSTSDSMGRITSTGTAEGLLQAQGQRALESIVEALRRSAFRELDGLDFPIVFDDGAPGDPGFAPHAHVAWASRAGPNEPGFGPQRAIVFVLPSDLDGDRRPEVDADLNGFPELDGDGDGVYTDSGADIAGLWDPDAATIDPDTTLVWSHEQVSYVLVAGPDGESALERRIDGDPAGARRVARYVDRIEFDTPESSGFEVPLGAVRVRLFLRMDDGRGRPMRARHEVTVSLRNG